MEVETADRNKEFKIWQMVANVGRTIQSKQMHSWQCYILETLDGKEYSRALNGKYLKKYYPSVWVDA